MNGSISKRRMMAWILSAAIGLLGLTAGRVARAAEPEYGGTLRHVGELEAAGFDALQTRALTGTGRLAASLVMEKLFERDDAGELVPALGLSLQPSQDETVWTIRLRQNVRFHDGTPFTADAVVEHWNRLIDPEQHFQGRNLLTPVAAVEKAGPYEVRFVLKHAWPAFDTFLTSPIGFTAYIPSPKAVAEGRHHHAPVGTGPFIFKEWKRGDRIVVRKNPDYWDKGKPYLDEVVCRAIPDHEARYATLVSGEADLMITDRPSHVKKLMQNPDFETHPVHWRGAGLLALNNARPPLDDIRVRRALALAWDQKAYVAASFKNIMPAVTHWYGDAVDCRDTGYPAPDPQKARALIAAYGKPVCLEYIHSASNRGREAGMIMQQMFKAIGVEVTPVPMDFPGIMKRIFSEDFDITSWLMLGYNDMGPITKAYLHSQSRWNVFRYADPEMDRLLDEQERTTDPQVRAKIMCAIVRKANADIPFLYLFGRTYYVFARKNVRNLVLTKSGEEEIRLAGIWLAP